MEKDELAYHRARATHELNLGLTSNCLAAARSHLKLSSLHLERVRELETCETPQERPLFVM